MAWDRDVDLDFYGFSFLITHYQMREVFLYGLSRADMLKEFMFSHILKILVFWQILVRTTIDQYGNAKNMIALPFIYFDLFASCT